MRGSAQRSAINHPYNVKKQLTVKPFGCIIHTSQNKTELKMAAKSAWADLPNAKYIDLVIDSVKKNPAAWDAAWAAARTAALNAARTAALNAARTAALNAARTAALDAAWDTAWDAAWNAALDAAWDAARNAAWGAILSLIAWDDCDYLLEENPENVKMLALLGNQAAVLLYPACVALQNVKELEMA
jgi:hypothetical protein